MRVSHNWLRELLPALTLTPTQVAASLTSLGLEVEAVREHGAGLDAVLVVAVSNIEPHPKRDKLRLVTVDLGAGKTQRVVCGAANVPDPGGLVVLAPLGTHLPAVGLTLTPREIGGVLSEGMLCSETELGLNDKSDGIVILPAGSAEAGSAFLHAFPEARDTVYELSLTPNRPDALGHMGVARDLGALHKLELTAPPAEKAAPLQTLQVTDRVSIENEEPERCPRYGAALVQGVRVGPSPSWMRWRLQRLGVRPICNVVDVTNWLLLEYGHPMHAFDLRLVADQRIVIRRAAEGEKFTTLDGVERVLSDDDLMICDGQRPVALAGVMGGANTEIRDSTQEVLLECAYFTPAGIRRASRRHALHSESSHRFERGVNWGGIAAVLERAKSLLCEVAGAQAVSPGLLVRGKILEAPTLTLRERQLQRLLGTALPFREATDALSRLGFRIVRINDGAEPSAVVEGQSARPDVTLEADLIEEVARVIGYDRIPTVLPRIAPGAARSTGKMERHTRQVCAALGLSEIVTHAFISPADVHKLGLPAAAVTLQNPLGEERSVMRTTLLPGLLDALRRARRHGSTDIALFEVASVFLAPSSTPQSEPAQAARPRNDEDRGVVPQQPPLLAAVLAGDRPAHLSKPEALDLYDAKAIACGIVERVTGNRATVQALPTSHPGAHYLHPRARALLCVEKTAVGSFGALHPDTVDAFDLDGGAFVVELDLAALEVATRAVAKYSPIARLPAVTRDVALELPSEIPAAEVQRVIAEAGGELCESVSLFDLFEGGSLKAGHRSLAFHVVYRDPRAKSDPENARTLTDAEVDQCHAKVVKIAGEKFGAQLRA